MAAPEKTLPGEFGKGAFWGTVVASGLLMINGIFSAAAAGYILSWGLGVGAIMGTIYAINKLAEKITK